jgi:homoserine O-acetyltransferase
MRLRLVDGCVAGLPLGGAVPARRLARRHQLRRRTHVGAQSGLPARADGGAGSRARAPRAGRFAAEPIAAKRAFGRIYAGWALSQDFYRAGLHLAGAPPPNLGAPDLETFLRTDWEERFAARPAANLYAQLRTWDAADISANALYGGDLLAALRAIRARVLLLPGETDLYFRVADNAAELPHLAHAELRPIPSIWGHRAGNPVVIPADAAFVKHAMRDWLAR